MLSFFLLVMLPGQLFMTSCENESQSVNFLFELLNDRTVLYGSWNVLLLFIFESTDIFTFYNLTSNQTIVYELYLIWVLMHKLLNNSLAMEFHFIPSIIRKEKSPLQTGDVHYWRKGNLICTFNLALPLSLTRCRSAVQIWNNYNTSSSIIANYTFY